MTSPQAPSAGLGSNSQSFSYRTYKQETSQLSFWIINTSNALLGTGRAKLPTSDADDLPSMNTTGRTTVQQMVKMCRLIGNNVPLLAAGRVPGFVFALFQSVLAARRHANSIYERVKALGSRNPNLERYNKGHRHFIESLQASFDTLGGQAWAAALERGETVSDGDALSALFTNRFALLRIEDEADAFELADEPSDPGPSRPQSRRKPNGKGKKGERTPKAPKAKPAPEPVVEIPLEDYGIITDSDDYMAAVFMLLTEWEDCRDTVQDALGATWPTMASTVLSLVQSPMLPSPVSGAASSPSSKTSPIVTRLPRSCNIFSAMISTPLLKIDTLWRYGQYQTTLMAPRSPRAASAPVSA